MVGKTKEQLLNELAELRQRVAELEASEAERRRVEEALRESEERYRHIFEHSPIGIGISSLDGKVVTANKAMQAITGYSAEELSKISLADTYVNVEDRKALFEAVGRYGGVLDFPVRLKRKDGTPYDALLSISRINLRGKDFYHTIEQDITERKRAEEALRHSEAQLSNAMNIAKLGYWEYDVAENLFTFNDHFYSIFRTSTEQVGGYKMSPDRYAELFLHPDDMSVVATEIKKALETTDPHYSRQLEHRIIYADGEIGYISVRFFVVKDDQGRTIKTFGANQDITERKRAEEALCESESKYRTLVENIPQKIFTKDRDSVYVSCNENFARDLGIRPDQIAGKTDYDFFPRELADKYRADDKRIMEAGRTEEIEEKYLQAGQEVWVQTVKTPVRQEDGRVVGILGVFWDITARKQAENELRKFKTISDRAGYGIVIVDLEGNVSYVNTAFARMHGYTSDELIGKHLSIFHTEQQMANVNRLTEQLNREGSYVAEEVWRKKNDNTEFPTLMSGTFIKDETGNPLFIAGTAIDITERKRAERLLHALNRAALAMERSLTHEEIFAAVAEEFQKLGFSCMILLADESRSRLFVRYLSYENGALRAAEKLLGFKHEDFSMPIEDVDIYRNVVREKQSVFVEDAATIVLRQLLPRSVKRFTAQAVRMLKVPKSIITPLIAEDEVIGVLSVQSDDLTEADVPAITAFAHQVAAAWHKANLMQDLQRSLEELERTQDQLVQAQKMEAIGRLAGGVAHDFNNLLTAIIGYSEFLLASFDHGDPRRKDVEEIKKAADRAAALTRQLLAFSRKQVLQLQVLDLNAIISNMEKMLRRLIGEDIELVTVLDPALGRVKADPGQIEQVLMNLAVNARDAMPQGGKLTIETMNAYLDEDYARRHVDVQPGPHVMLAVSDTGVGMDAGTQAHLFEPFFTTKQVGQGTGLGLSTVYGIVKQSNGHIWVYSEPGHGTTFKIYLPMVEEVVELAEERTPVAAISQTGVEAVLLVEDNDDVRDLARRVLLQHGYSVLEARDGEEALLICERHEGPVHLLVTDVVMPGGLSGRQLAERLAALYPGMKVLYMSGYTDNAIVHHGVLEPGMAFLQKPFSPDVLVCKVREVLDTP